MSSLFPPLKYTIIYPMVEREQGFRTPEEEIQELERRLEEKKRSLAESGSEAVPEKEAFREVLKEHIGAVRQTPPGKSPQASSAPNTKADDDVARLKDEFKEDVRMLIEIAMTKSVEEAVRTAEHAGNPYLLDELHDHLIDDYYDKLISLRKIRR